MPLDKTIIRKYVTAALREDAARQDITTLSFIPKGVKVQARIIAQEKGVVCGLALAREAFRAFGGGIIFKERKKDGQQVRKGTVIAILEGRARSILSCGRVALNFLSYLGGISTQTHQAVSRVHSKGIRILDTRKTTPLFRYFEKYAVLMGGGKNHRFNLSDQYLVKDNHLVVLKKSCGLSVLRRRNPGVPFEIEVENLGELKDILCFYPDIVMLDNFSPKEVKKAIFLLRASFPDKNKRPFIELSGGISPENISGYAIKGIDFISLGSLTHSAKALNISLEITKCL